eukprot:Rmarinus@m.20326
MRLLKRFWRGRSGDKHVSIYYGKPLESKVAVELQSTTTEQFRAFLVSVRGDLKRDDATLRNTIDNCIRGNYHEKLDLLLSMYPPEHIEKAVRGGAISSFYEFAISFGFHGCVDVLLKHRCCLHMLADQSVLRQITTSVMSSSTGQRKCIAYLTDACDDLRPLLPFVVMARILSPDKIGHLIGESSRESLSVVDSDGSNFLHYLVRVVQDLNTIRLGLERAQHLMPTEWRSFVVATNKAKQSPISLALRPECADAVLWYLLDQCPEASVQVLGGELLVHHAVAAGRSDIVEGLDARAVNLNAIASDAKFQTAYTLALFNHAPMLRLVNQISHKHASEAAARLDVMTHALQQERLVEGASTDTGLYALPDDIIFLVLQLLPLKTVLSFGNVCHRFRLLAHDPLLWRDLTPCRVLCGKSTRSGHRGCVVREHPDQWPWAEEWVRACISARHIFLCAEKRFALTDPEDVKTLKYQPGGDRDSGIGEEGRNPQLCQDITCGVSLRVPPTDRRTDADALRTVLASLAPWIRELTFGEYLPLQSRQSCNSQHSAQPSTEKMTWNAITMKIVLVPAITGFAEAGVTFSSLRSLSVHWSGDMHNTLFAVLLRHELLPAISTLELVGPGSYLPSEVTEQRFREDHGSMGVRDVDVNRLSCVLGSSGTECLGGSSSNNSSGSVSSVGSIGGNAIVAKRCARIWGRKPAVSQRQKPRVGTIQAGNSSIDSTILSTGHPSLSHLRLEGCGNLSYNFLYNLPKLYPSVESVSIEHSGPLASKREAAFEVRGRADSKFTWTPKHLLWKMCDAVIAGHPLRELCVCSCHVFSSYDIDHAKHCFGSSLRVSSTQLSPS